eukprot:scaffold318868_cov18-Prasinocladus_malaysianus.AAC.1
MLEVRGDYPAALDYYQQVNGPGHHLVLSHIIGLLAGYEAAAEWLFQASTNVCSPSTYKLEICLILV